MPPRRGIVMKGYTTREVARMLGVSEARVRGFARAGFLEPSRGPQGEYRFSFQDLVLLRAAKGLAASKVPPRRLTRALLKLKERLPEGYPLSSVHIEAYGDRVVVRRGGGIWNPESGQSQFDFEVQELVEKVEPHARKAVDQAEAAERPMEAEDWYELGFDLEAAAPDEASRAYHKALEQDPSHVNARVNLGRLLLIAGQLNAAETQFRLALADGPNTTALFNLGVVLEDLGRRDEAVRAYREAVEADPSFADAYFNLARLLVETGDARGALRCLKTYRDLTGIAT